MIKLTVLYGHPADPAAFENYYATTHMPLSEKMSGVLRHEKAKVVSTPTGDKPPYHRMFEAWFESEAFRSGMNRFACSATNSHGPTAKNPAFTRRPVVL